MTHWTKNPSRFSAAGLRRKGFMYKVLVASVYWFCLLTANGQTLTNDERNLVIEMLEANTKRFLADIENISDAQWNYKPATDSWSVAEVSEHITLSDGLLLSIAQRSLKSPADSIKAHDLLGKEQVVIDKLKDRSYKAQAPESLRPLHRFPSRLELIEAFKQTRERTADYVKTTNDSLKDHVVPHPLFGDLTAYQWLVMIPAHANRHIDQLDEVKALKNFPLE